MMNENESMLFHEWLSKPEITQELIETRPIQHGWRGNTIRCFTEIRTGKENGDNSINWDMIADKVECDLIYLKYFGEST